MSCPELLTRGGPDYAEIVPFARALVDRFPDRIIWGTDWPHSNLKSHMSDDGKLVDYPPHCDHRGAAAGIASVPYLTEESLLTANQLDCGHETG